MLSGVAVEKKTFGYYGVECEPEQLEECKEFMGSLGQIVMVLKDYVMIQVPPKEQTKFLKKLEKCCKMSGELYWSSSITWVGKPKKK